MTVTDIEKHSARAAEARRRIALAAALHGSAARRAAGDPAVILAGVCANFWLVAGIGRKASEGFIGDLINDFGTAIVLASAVELCLTQPPGPKAWLRRACEQRA